MTWLLACLITIPPVTWIALAAGAALVALAVRPVASLIGAKRLRKALGRDETDEAGA